MSSGNILVVEDNLQNLKMLKIILEETGYIVRPATNGKIALSAANAILPDLILLDIKLPDTNGYDICISLKENPLTKDVPIIFLTGRGDNNDIIKGFEIGAADYITKPYDKTILLARVKTHIKLRLQTIKLQKLSEIDELSDLANRRRFDSFLESEWRRCGRENNPISLMMCDIDYFKFYNDTYGHQLGDNVIKRVASVLKRYGARPSDLQARYGGEEFGFIMGNADEEYILSIANDLCKEVEALKITHEKSKVGNFVTISIGVATMFPGKSTDHTKLILEADKMLYKAKDEGRNRAFGVNC